MKKLLVLILGVSFISVALSSTTEASAREWDYIECQPGFYWKKGGWTAGGYHKAGGFCIPMHTRWTKLLLNLRLFHEKISNKKYILYYYSFSFKLYNFFFS